MAEKYCECGCGASISPQSRWVRGHHWRAKRDEAGIPESKVCERCGVTYSRTALRSRQGAAHWISRKYCTHECAREATVVPRGEESPNWKGEQITDQAGRKRARQLFPETPSCECCGTNERIERHHIDGNPTNNAKANIAFLCRGCHIAVEDRMGYRRVVDTPGRLAHRRRLSRARSRRYRSRKRQTAT